MVDVSARRDAKLIRRLVDFFFERLGIRHAKFSNRLFDCDRHDASNGDDSIDYDRDDERHEVFSRRRHGHAHDGRHDDDQDDRDDRHVFSQHDLDRIDRDAGLVGMELRDRHSLACDRKHRHR